MKTRVCALLAAGLVASAPATVSAQEGGWYLGVGAGQVTVEESTFDLEGTDTAYKAFVGYQFNRHFGLEGGYFDGGAPGDSIGTIYAETDVSAFHLSATALVPIGEHFALLARAGALYWDSDATVVDFGFPGFAVTSSETGTDFLWGAGAQVSIGPVVIRAEYEQSDIDTFDYSLVSGSVIYRF